MFYHRIIDGQLKLQRPTNITTGKKGTFKHHSPRNRADRKRDQRKCYNQHEVTRKRDRETGLDSVKFKMGRTYQNCVNDTPYTLLNVVLECDHLKTPWCDCTGGPSRSVKQPKNLVGDEDVIAPIFKKKNGRYLQVTPKYRTINGR